MEHSNLLGLTRMQLIHLMKSWGESSFRGTQIFKWIHQRGILDINMMSDIPTQLRKKLSEEVIIEAPEYIPVLSDENSKDSTSKFLIKTSSGSQVEMVLIPQGGENTGGKISKLRQTLCISTQAGCAVNCSFCVTGKQGFNSNLSASEIIGQLWLATHHVESSYKRQHNNVEKNIVSNVVFMGMGEPLLNVEPVLSACEVFTDDLAYGLSKKKVTISTSGIVPEIENMCGRTDVALAVSLHSADDDLRNTLVPINRKYPIDSIIQACKKYLSSLPSKDRSITFEYTLLSGVNDSTKQAQMLAKLLSNIPCKINLIPYNPSEFLQYERPSDRQIYDFATVLINKGFLVTTRKTRGDEINAACGQLAGKVISRSRIKV